PNSGADRFGRGCGGFNRGERIDSRPHRAIVRERGKSIGASLSNGWIGNEDVLLWIGNGFRFGDLRNGQSDRAGRKLHLGEATEFVRFRMVPNLDSMRGSVLRKSVHISARLGGVDHEGRGGQKR